MINPLRAYFQDSLFNILFIPKARDSIKAKTTAAVIPKKFGY
jgi:hypothetical protein